jgi:hypothetical protein
MHFFGKKTKMPEFPIPSQKNTKDIENEILNRIRGNRTKKDWM